VSELKKSARAKVLEIVRDAAIVTVGSAVVALVFNAVRSEGIRLVQQEEYDILVPCPEPVGDPEVMNADDGRIKDSRSLVLDVRSKGEFGSWHLEGAQNQPFDWLGPPVDEEVKAVAKQVAASRAQRVVVYGDGDDPDSGQEWAKLLSGARIKNVFYVKGGAPALNPALPKPEGLDLPPLDEPGEPEAPAPTPEESDATVDATVDAAKEAP
jgi:rhodanese-related sulfurtransferase